MNGRIKLNLNIAAWLCDDFVRDTVFRVLRRVLPGNLEMKDFQIYNPELTLQVQAAVVLLQLESQENLGSYYDPMYFDSSQKPYAPSFDLGAQIPAALFYRSLPNRTDFCRRLEATNMVGDVPFKRLTFQSIFDKAWQKFIVEKCKPAVVDTTCLYYNPDNDCRCAIGWSLPDIPRILDSRCNFSELVEDCPFIFDAEIIKQAKTDFAYLDRFQESLHDNYALQNGEWTYSDVRLEERYRQVAADYNLTVPGATV